MASNSSENYMHILSTYLVPVIFSLVTFIGIFGNLLVVLVIIANIQMRNTTNILIISLALADILFIIFVVPFTGIIYFMDDWSMGQVMCSLHGFLTFATTYCSVYTLVLMSVDRYLAVVHAIESLTWRTSRNTIIAVVCVWLAAFAFNIPLALDHQLMEQFTATTNKSQRWCLNQRMFSYNVSMRFITPYDPAYSKFYYTCFFAMGYLVPLATIVALYGFLVRKLLYSRIASVSQSAEAMRSKRRVTHMVVIVIVVFAICWGPLHTIFLIQMYAPSKTQNKEFHTAQILCQVLAYANSCMNPILYAFLSENFRRAFAKFLCLPSQLPLNGTRAFEVTRIGGSSRATQLQPHNNNKLKIPSASNNELELRPFSSEVDLGNANNTHSNNDTFREPLICQHVISTDL